MINGGNFFPLLIIPKIAVHLNLSPEVLLILISFYPLISYVDWDVISKYTGVSSILINKTFKLLKGLSIVFTFYEIFSKKSLDKVAILSIILV